MCRNITETRSSTQDIKKDSLWKNSSSVNNVHILDSWVAHRVEGLLACLHSSKLIAEIAAMDSDKLCPKCGDKGKKEEIVFKK